MVGPKRTRETEAAQLAARGMSRNPPADATARQVSYVPSSIHGDASLSSAAYAAAAITDVATMTRKAGGNHVCRPDVCHKGHIGRKGFCRMYFWHWARSVNKVGQASAVRQHGLLLHKHWDGQGVPPISASAPSTGLPELETNHPFHFKMNPAVLLGPKCNHDVGVLLRLPVQTITGGRPSTREAACEAMLDAMGDHEFYCAAYSSKDAPHIGGLLQTLADAKSAKEAEIQAARDAGEAVPVKEQVRQTLHRLLSATNRRMHKGFPELVTYILNKPMEYSSHKLVECFLPAPLSFAVAAVLARAGVADNIQCPDAQVAPRPFGKQNAYRLLNTLDYRFRPLALERFPLYFFMASCYTVGRLNHRCMDWCEVPSPTGILRHDSYDASPLQSKSVPGLCLLDVDGKPLHGYTYYVALRTQEAWHVPVLLGFRPPAVPHAEATPEERGRYGLVLQLLFRPHRSFALLAELAIGAGTPRGDMKECDAWEAVYTEFVRWRSEEVYPVADRYKSGTHPKPAFDSADWWACMIAERLQNYDVTYRKRGAQAIHEHYICVLHF